MISQRIFPHNIVSQVYHQVKLIYIMNSTFLEIVQHIKLCKHKVQHILLTN